MRSQPGPDVDESHRVSVSGAQAPFVIVREELRLVCCDVDLTGTIAFAAFACEAKVERLFYRVAFPSIFDDVALHHIEQQMSPAAGRVLFLTRDHVTGAHVTTFGAAAHSYADTAQSGVIEAPMVIGIFEVGDERRRVVIGSDFQVFVEQIGGSPISLPGFILYSGSQIALNSRIACMSSGPNIFGHSSPRDWPSPCSPE